MYFNKKLSILMLVLISVVTVNAQNVKLIKGKIVSDLSDSDGVSVVNLRSEQSTISENGGYFNINCKEGDTLMFSAVHFIAKKVVLMKSEIIQSLLLIKLESKINKLDEVKITQNNSINAVSLGVLSKKPKTLTAAERKLYTATSGSGLMPIDPLLNLISGRTKMLKKELVIENKEILLQKIEDWFEEKYFIEKHKIPKEYIKGFWYYALEDDEIVAALKSKNRTLVSFLFGDLAVKYNQLIKMEK